MGIVTEIRAMGAREPSLFTHTNREIPEWETPSFCGPILVFAVVSSHAK